ncbi:MAG: 5'/3'-nucleotidase SurE [Paludibacteraceae bacterium]|nr:5'/3'-nucleotidase SurE [Paludibacteraceae bacterium]
MEILITNDDGWGAKGIMTLVRIMETFGHVTVVAPGTVQSGKSNAITFDHLLLHEIERTDNHVVYTTNGTPSDCVKLAIHIIYKGQKPDLLVSGINHGSNAAINVIYSGTMGAVFVGAENGIRSIGFSLDSYDPDADFSHFEPYIVQIVNEVLKGTLNFKLSNQAATLNSKLSTLNSKDNYGLCWNVNAPVGEIKGVRITRQCQGYWDEEVATIEDEEGGVYYKLGGQFCNSEPDAEDTDEWALHHGYIAITPSTIDTTHLIYYV